MIMSARKTPRYTKTAIPAAFEANSTGYADFCHQPVTVAPKIKLQNN